MIYPAKCLRLLLWYTIVGPISTGQATVNKRFSYKLADRRPYALNCLYNSNVEKSFWIETKKPHRLIYDAEFSNYWKFH